MNPIVSVKACKDYSEAALGASVPALLDGIDALSFVRPGMHIAIKVNLVSAMAPDAAATSHPALIRAVARLLRDRGATVIIGDSPGGLFTRAHLKRVYDVTGLSAIEEDGITLNRDVTVASYQAPGARSLRDASYTAWLDSCDAIVNLCRLKSHGMMTMSAAVKNMFGTIPGLTKPEMHFRFPEPDRFAGVMLDLCDHFKPVLSITDAIVAMEGNGPTQGKPRPIGLLLASRDPHALDLTGAALMGLSPDQVPTLRLAAAEGLLPASLDDAVTGDDYHSYIQSDFDNIKNPNSLLFSGKGNLRGRLLSAVARRALASVPKVRPDCIGCGVCARICPAHAITLRRGKAHIDRNVCIRCFCCQEFCPEGKMVVHRPLPARLLNRR